MDISMILIGIYDNKKRKEKEDWYVTTAPNFWTSDENGGGALIVSATSHRLSTSATAYVPVGRNSFSRWRNFSKLAAALAGGGISSHG